VDGEARLDDEVAGEVAGGAAPVLLGSTSRHGSACCQRGAALHHWLLAKDPSPATHAHMPCGRTDQIKV